MKMNYNSWFYKYHRYLTGVRKGAEGYNDTKWKNINQRMQTLINLESSIIEEQPLGVVSNYKGFEKLVDLIDKSNYTFQDLNDALIDTYKMSYENAMSRMLVNTHVVVSHCNNNDKHIVHQYKNDTKYYIVDVPYNQMHFGDRDEMIRQYLQELYSRQNGFYMPMDRLISNSILTVLGFTFICTTNGLICNDWGVAIDDKGFHFKIGWGKGYDVNFIIYKIDVAKIVDIKTTTDIVQSGYISVDKTSLKVGDKCIINIFDDNRKTFVRSIPNFGIVTENGLEIHGLQGKSITEITRFGVNNCRVLIYVPKYIFELPNTYPAVNFCDMLYLHPILTENGDDVYTSDGKPVIGRMNDYNDDVPTCTPPICVDRSASVSFDILLDAMNLSKSMMNYNKQFLDIGYAVNKQSLIPYDFIDMIVNPAKNLLDAMKNFYALYMKAGILTSFVTYQNQYDFQSLIRRLQTFVDRVSNTNATLSTAKAYAIDEFYGIYYSELVKKLTGAFDIAPLDTFRKLNKNDFTRSYFGEFDKNTRITRPISEQCFMALRYSNDEECWVFTCPQIQHFHGIGNTFYINDGLRGDEVFKFFILYTDTEDPMMKNVEPFDFNTIVDFDKFSEEVDSYQAYIRYWNVENHLRKISKILYSDDSTDKQFHVLSKILLGKLAGEELLDLYPTDMNYEPSNVTSDNIKEYDEDTERGPFVVNFLFYTILMMYDNKDQLLSYFINKLTKDNFSNRYSDIDISSVIEKTEAYPINYSGYVVAPTQLSTYTTSSSGLTMFYGIPDVYNASGTSQVASAYKYTFHQYYDETKFASVTMDSTLDDEYYATISVPSFSDYKYDFEAFQMFAKYIAYCHDFMNTVETRYTYSFSNASEMTRVLDKVFMYKSWFEEHQNDPFTSTTTKTFVDAVVTSINHVATTISQLSSFIRQTIAPPSMTSTIFDYMNKVFLKELRRVYNYYGFDEFSQRRIKALYQHMKKINTPMDLYEYLKWVGDIDFYCLQKLSDSFAANENNTPLPKEAFDQYYTKLSAFANESIIVAEYLKNVYNEIASTVRTDDVDGLCASFYDAIMNASKDLYAIERVNINSNTTTFQSKPKYVIVTADLTDPNGNTSSEKLIFVPFSEENNSGYRIKELNPICEYAFFTSNQIVPTAIAVYDESGSTMNVDSLIVTLDMIKVGSTSDIANDVYQLPNITHMEFEFQNVHEYSTTVGNLAASYKIGNLNYELLAGNRFMPLTYEQEYVLDRTTMLPGPIDNVNIPNMTLNQFAKSDYSNHDYAKFYFKPTQVFHPDIEDGVLTSINGKYHVGQTLYVKTNDAYEFTFPIIIRSIDHSIPHGFVEAIVDYNHAGWLQVDAADIERYLTEGIECVTIDDNVSNFMAEFSSDYDVYNFPPNPPEIDADVTAYTLPGDPIYVQRNCDYVYSRLEWMFGMDIPNRFYDEDSKRYRFVYITSGSIITNDTLTINLINHDFNSMTLPEMYPVLRQEPNAHFTYAEEQTVFTKKYTETESKYQQYLSIRDVYETEYENAETQDEKLRWQLKLEDVDLKIAYTKSFMERLDDYIHQPESPTTWFNLYAYDDAITYIENGRARMAHIPRFNIRDILYTDKIEVRMYDWENKCWLNPNDFTITTTVIDNTMFDEDDNYATDNVQYTLTITPEDNTFHSNKILVYFVYKTSDIYDDIELHPNTFNVRFKPALSLYTEEDDIDLYADIRIRKHYDTNEVYRVTDVYENEDFSLTNGYYIQRIRRSGKYPDASIIRWNDLSVIANSNEYDISDFDVYERFPFPNVDTNQRLTVPVYFTNITVPIDGFTPNETITLICIQSDYSDGNVSSILFQAQTSLVNDTPTITIIDSSYHYPENGIFICTIAKDPMYQSCGGLITVTIAKNKTTQIMDANHKWHKVTNPEFKIVPNEFILVPKSITPSTPFTVEFHNHYVNPTTTQSPYTYYYDTKHLVRYPISNIYRNKIDERLVINQTQDTTVKQIKSNYVGVCRYSIQHIPKNGLIDVTGYIPTPLSRKRYEFWVNGRCITNSDKLIIVSPTVMQLRNLTSLRNFELIELVDDMSLSQSVFPTGGVYTDLEGHTFTSYLLALMSNQNIRYQNMKYRFYWNTKSKLDTYVGDIVKNPNNDNVEEDILSYITLPSSVTSYHDLFNIPTINGVPLYHPTTTDLGLMEIPAEKIVEDYDKTWRYEMTMSGVFPFSNRDLLSSTQYMNILVHPLRHIETSGDTCVYRIITTGQCNKYFTIYITTNPEAPISSGYTKKIIPMLSLGTEIIVGDEFHGMYVCTTFENCKPKRIE